MRFGRGEHQAAEVREWLGGNADGTCQVTFAAGTPDSEVRRWARRYGDLHPDHVAAVHSSGRSVIVRVRSRPRWHGPDDTL